MTNTPLFGCGWETGSILAEPPMAVSIPPITGPTVSGAVSLEGTIVRTGAGSLKVAPASGAAGYWNASAVVGYSIGAGSLPTFWRFYVRITSSPPASTRMLWGDNAAFELRLNSSGQLILYSNSDAAAVGTSITTLTDTTKWYRIEIKLVDGSQEVRINGSTAITGALAVSAGTGQKCYFGSQDTAAATYTAYFDDLYACYGDTWPGEGMSILLLPISDNARATLWTGGSGGTTELYKGVCNRPPNGKATETNLTQIEHGGGAAGTTDAYDANMTAYSTAGITSGSVINLTMPFMWTGEDSATGDKLLTYNIASNPTTSARSNFNVAGTSSGATGDWPTGWWVTISNIGGAPTTLSSPVMRVTRPETANRVASVCFMGIYVDYTPATSSPKRMRAAILGV